MDARCLAEDPAIFRRPFIARIPGENCLSLCLSRPFSVYILHTGLQNVARGKELERWESFIISIRGTRDALSYQDFFCIF
jgi:hypothetical protein